jgi:hypothetical protein
VQIFYNLTFYFEWVLNLVSDIKRRTWVLVLGIRVLRGIFFSKREKVAVGWRKVYNGELHNLYCSSNVIMMGGECSTYERADSEQNLSENKGRDLMGDMSIDGRIILKWISKK